MKNISTKRLTVIGQGYVGLPLAMAAVNAGWTVVGIDNDIDKVNRISSGSSPIEDISDLQLKIALQNNSYTVTNDFSKIIGTTVIVFCVPTPLNENRKPNLNLLKDAVEFSCEYFSESSLIINESTSYPGTLRSVIIPIVKERKARSFSTMSFASAPERINPGDKVWTLKNTPRLVGGIDPISSKRAKEFYDSICDAVVEVSSPEVAEAGKLLENTFRLVNIALINEFAQLCSRANIKVHEVINAAATKPYGFMEFRPGVGVGGHCIPVDPLYLTWWARQSGYIAQIVEISDAINGAMPLFVAKKALSLVSLEVVTPRVLILGVAYKEGTSDVRETPVAKLRDHLQELGAEVSWYDPLVLTWGDTNPVNLDWPCDLVIAATKQSNIDIGNFVSRKIPILDCTNSYSSFPGISSL
jgi:UDP-N-acetyl-D-glucosamine dehydrogenase